MAAADASLPGGDGARRRELERTAFGPASTEAERRAALDALSELSPSHAQTGSEPSPGAPPVAAGGPEREPRRIRRFLVAGGGIALVLLGAAVIPPLLEPSSLEVFSLPQTDADRDVPFWVSNAVAAGASASGGQGAGADLFASLRVLPADGGPAFAFTDGVDVCLAALRSVECVSRDAFAAEGLELVAVDPTAVPASGAVFSWGPRGRLRSGELPSGRVEIEGADRAERVIACMTAHGHEASVDARDQVVPGAQNDPGSLDFEMARLDCVIRFPPETSVDP